MERKKHISVRVSNDEYSLIKEQADIAALTVSEYIRRRTLGKRVASKLDLCVLAEIRRLGGLLKHVHVESGGAYSRDTASALRAVENYIRTASKRLKED